MVASAERKGNRMDVHKISLSCGHCGTISVLSGVCCNCGKMVDAAYAGVDIAAMRRDDKELLTIVKGVVGVRIGEYPHDPSLSPPALMAAQRNAYDGWAEDGIVLLEKMGEK